MSGVAPRLIEFFSIPGAGKSTLARALAAELPVLTRGDLTASWARQSAAAKCGYMLSGLSDAGAARAAAALAARARLFNGESLFRLGRLLAKGSWLRSHDRPILLDQGPLQELWSILYAADQLRPPLRPLSALISRLYKGIDVRIVHLDLDPASAGCRIAERPDGDSRLDGLKPEAIAERLRDSSAIPQTLLDAAQTAGIQVVRRDASQPVSQLLEQLRPLVRPGLE